MGDSTNLWEVFPLLAFPPADFPPEDIFDAICLCGFKKAEDA